MKVSLQNRKKRIQSSIQRIERRLSRISGLRLISFLSIPLTATLLYYNQIELFLSLGCLGLEAILFYGIVIHYSRIERYKERLLSKEQFLVREMLREEKKIKSLFRSIPVSENIRNNHPFCEDLNLFEKDGLFSLIDTTSTVEGEKLFISNFLQKNDESIQDILARQENVKKLASNPFFSYKFIRKASENWEFFLGEKWNTNGWKRTEFRFFAKRKFLRIIFPALSIIGGILITSSFLFQSPFGAGLFILNTILFIGYRQDSLREFKNSEAIQKRQFQTKQLVLHINQVSKKYDSKRINQIFKKFESTLSTIYTSPLPHFLANAIYLHDLWKMRKMQSWIEENNAEVSTWIQDLEEVDSLMAVVHLKFHNPEWIFPNISEENQSIEGKDLSHPLLQKDVSIANPIERLDKGKILLVTGSNMAGKTTYMRTVGTNVLLGLCGGPVPASSLSFPPVKITCSVKNQDSLTEGISLFYAEARRLSQIFSSLKNSKTSYLILLDEILKGTNTKERYLASEAILKQLQDANAFTLCTTHDLDLAKIPNLELVHFTEKIENNEMSFDYKIKPGVVQTTNALFILRKEGVVP